jgi:hypothetical protein
MRYRSYLLIMSAVGLIIGLGSGVAYAYFTGSGKGTGSASIGTMQPVTLVSATVAPSTLLPGGTGDVTLKVKNQNSFAVTLVSVTGTGVTITADTGHPGCTTTGVTFTNQTSLNTSIPASTTATIDLPGAAFMSTASSAGCQGATFSIPVTITVHK